MSIHPESAVEPSARRMATRDRLLEAAAEAFSEEGLLGASVEAICTRAGFSRGAFYSNFASKEQLFLTLLQREFVRRTLHLERQAAVLEPALREKVDLSHVEVANFISEFFSPENDATAWFVLETEFLLLAMRDPAIAPEYREFTERFYAGIAGAVEGIVGAAGRRFTIPVEQALMVFAGVYERELRIAALAGVAAPAASGTLGDHLSELLFALTEPMPRAG